MCATGEPLPFDQLLIEMHGCSEALVHKLISCLDKHGIYPFFREENPRGALCGKEVNLGLDAVEMAFVRADSRFSVPRVAVLDVAASTQQQRRRNTTATTATATHLSPKGSSGAASRTQRRRLAAALAYSAAPDVSGLVGFRPQGVKLFMTAWTAHARMTRRAGL